jgi:hypothetical protein
MWKVKTRLSILATVMVALWFSGGCSIETGGDIDPGDGGNQKDGSIDPGDGGDSEDTNCTDDCVVGERACQDNGFVVCGEFDDDPCRDWSEPIECDSDKICEEGQCQIACSDQCQVGGRRCTGEAYQECGDHDDDPCLDWSADIPCADGKICLDDTVTCVYKYPSGPYGTGHGDTMENLCLEKCVCSGGSPQAESFCLEEFLGNQAIMVTLHTGWCPGCRDLAAQLEDGLYQPYKAKGFEIVMVLLEDDRRSSNRSALLNYCCEEKTSSGMTFTVAIDPGGQKTGQYFDQGILPLSMLVDDKMVIRYKNEGAVAGLEATLQDLLNP